MLELHEINRFNRAPKQTPLIFCLALVARYDDGKFSSNSVARSRAYNLLPSICRIPTHLFQFAEFSEKAGCGKSTGNEKKKAFMSLRFGTVYILTFTI